MNDRYFHVTNSFGKKEDNSTEGKIGYIADFPEAMFLFISPEPSAHR